MPSGSRPSACRRTSSRASPSTIAQRPTGIGNYPIVCNLLCGLGHSLMRSDGPRRLTGAVPGVAEESQGSWRARGAASTSSGGGGSASSAGNREHHDRGGYGIMSRMRVDEPINTGRRGRRADGRQAPCAGASNAPPG